MGEPECIGECVAASFRDAVEQIIRSEGHLYGRGLLSLVNMIGVAVKSLTNANV